MRVNIDARGVPSGAPQTIQTFPGTFISDMSVAHHGTTVLWLFQGVANLWAVDVPKRGMAQLVALTADDVRNTQLRHFRDDRIAFNRKLSFAWLDIATRQLTPLPVNGDGALSPSPSPDGRQIAFHVINEGGVINVWTQAVDGGTRKQVTFDDEAMSYPAWSPDGHSIVVEIKRGDDTRIGIVSKDGGEVEMLVSERGQSWQLPTMTVSCLRARAMACGTSTRCRGKRKPCASSPISRRWKATCVSELVAHT